MGRNVENIRFTSLSSFNNMGVGLTEWKICTSSLLPLYQSAYACIKTLPYM